MTNGLEFEYIVAKWYAPDGDARPFPPVKLSYLNNSVEAWALVDSGADMSLLPFQLGEELGLSWERSAPEFELHGLAGKLPAKAIAMDLEIGSWPSIKMAFA